MNHFHDIENNLCLSQYPYNKKYYTQDFICLIEYPPNYFMQFETNECMENCGDDYKITSIKTFFKKCPDGYTLYLSTTKEYVHDCISELPFKYDNKCIVDCK